MLLNCRTLAEIQRKVDKQGKRNVVVRLVHAKDDKDKIAAWKQDLVRVLNIFTVRSITSVGYLRTNLTVPFQAELTIDTNMTVADAHAVVTHTHTVVGNTHMVVKDTHAVVSDAHTMIADIHRNVLAGQEGASDQNHSVGATCYPLKVEFLPSLASSQVSDVEYNVTHSYVFTAFLSVNYLPLRQGPVSDAVI